MEIFRKLDRHAELVNRMASTVGADLDQALMRGQLNASELRSVVFRCVGCEGGPECPDWLDAHSAGASRAPDYCRNGDLFEALKR